MPKAIILSQAMFSKIFTSLDDRKTRAIFFVLICLVFALTAVYILQTGDLIKKTFIKTALETNAGKLSQTRNDLIKASTNQLSLAMVEEKIAGSDFVAVEQVQYIPLTASLADINQLASSIR